MTCGSGLARDGAMTVNIDVDQYIAFAGKPAPTEVLLCYSDRFD